MATKLKSTTERIKESNKNSPYTEAIRRWKESGGKVVGWACSWNYIPEELIWAAGMLPVRITGYGKEPQLEQADNYLYADSCSFSRSCFERTLQGQFDFLDGMVASSSCDGVRRFADVWKTYTKIPLIYVVDVPWKLTDRAAEFYAGEVTELQKRLEKHFRVSISKAALQESIKLYNRTRFLLSQIQELRKADNPPVSGSDMVELLHLAPAMPRPEFNSLLEDLLKELRTAPHGHSSSNPLRLMLNGSVLTNPDFVSGIESLGAAVVADSLGNGAGYWWGQVQQDHTSPESALAAYYFSKFPDPRATPTDKRFNLIAQIASDFRVDGVISQVIRFCAPLLFDQTRFRNWLKERNIPSLEMDIEYGMPLIGGAKTRVEAFLEIIRERKEKG